MKIEDLQPIQEVNRLTFVQERIKEYILANKLRPGDKLPTEEQLADPRSLSESRSLGYCGSATGHGASGT